MSQRILIVDDEESIRTSLHRLLEYKEYETRVAEDGFRALDILAEEPIDLVLLDIKMPRMDGLEVLQKIRERSADPFVVIITAHGDVAIQRRVSRPAVLVELPSAERPEVLAAYLHAGRARSSAASYARQLRYYFGFDHEPTSEELAAIADYYPVFRVDYS